MLNSSSIDTTYIHVENMAAFQEEMTLRLSNLIDTILGSKEEMNIGNLYNQWDAVILRENRYTLFYWNDT